MAEYYKNPSIVPVATNLPKKNKLNDQVKQVSLANHVKEKELYFQTLQDQLLALEQECAEMSHEFALEPNSLLKKRLENIIQFISDIKEKKEEARFVSQVAPVISEYRQLTTL
jgi:TolA-binding protein